MDECVTPVLHDVPGADGGAARALRQRCARALRPPGALQRLEELAAWLAGWQRTERPSVRAPAALVFVADHGVVAEGVSAYPAEVTAELLDALRAGVATAPVMARAAGARLAVVDAGVGRPTGNLASEPALTQERFLECFAAGRDAVAGCGADVLLLGEMGIGNTTAAAALSAVLWGLSAEDWTGRGTGVDPSGYARKLAAVEAARARLDPHIGPFEALRQVGGSELVAIAGAALEARLRSLPVLLDGFVVTAAAATLEVARPGALDHCVGAHCSAEPGHRLLLGKLGKEPLLDLGLRLGEASGALAALALLRLACAIATEVATFDEWERRRSS